MRVSWVEPRTTCVSWVRLAVWRQLGHRSSPKRLEAIIEQVPVFFRRAQHGAQTKFQFFRALTIEGCCCFQRTQSFLHTRSKTLLSDKPAELNNGFRRRARYSL